MDSKSGRQENNNHFRRNIEVYIWRNSLLICSFSLFVVKPAQEKDVKNFSNTSNLKDLKSLWNEMYSSITTCFFL